MFCYRNVLCNTQCVFLFYVTFDHFQFLLFSPSVDPTNAGQQKDGRMRIKRRRSLQVQSWIMIQMMKWAMMLWGSNFALKMTMIIQGTQEAYVSFIVLMVNCTIQHICCINILCLWLLTSTLWPNCDQPCSNDYYDDLLIFIHILIIIFVFAASLAAARVAAREMETQGTGEDLSSIVIHCHHCPCRRHHYHQNRHPRRS